MGGISGFHLAAPGCLPCPVLSQAVESHSSPLQLPPRVYSTLSHVIASPRTSCRPHTLYYLPHLNTDIPCPLGVVIRCVARAWTTSFVYNIQFSYTIMIIIIHTWASRAPRLCCTSPSSLVSPSLLQDGIKLEKSKDRTHLPFFTITQRVGDCLLSQWILTLGR